MDTGLGIKGLVMKGEGVLVLLKPNGDFDLPGGRVEEGESPEESLEREIFEELGRVRVRLWSLVATWSFVKRSRLLVWGDTWACTYLGGRICLRGEDSEYIWIKIGSINERSLLSITYWNWIRRFLAGKEDRGIAGFRHKRTTRGAGREFPRAGRPRWAWPGPPRRGPGRIDIPLG